MRMWFPFEKVSKHLLNENPDALFICAKVKRQQQLRQGEINID
ncbi:MULTISPECIES: hypothetical protein [Lysinibacillus]|nr:MULTISPECIES: hypothetical protein [Lysinibacillus]